MRIVETVDREFAVKLHRAIEENDGYCPCRSDRAPDTKCLCREFREMEQGACRCGLYIKLK